MADLGIHKIFLKNDFSFMDMGLLFILIEFSEQNMQVFILITYK